MTPEGMIEFGGVGLACFVVFVIVATVHYMLCGELANKDSRVSAMLIGVPFIALIDIALIGVIWKMLT